LSKDAATKATSSAPITFISSDGHALAPMREFRPYLEKRWHEEFDAFCDEYDAVGVRTFDPRNLLKRCDQATVAEWEHMVAPDRLEGSHDPQKRLEELKKEGISGEVLFPDFGLAFELYSPLVAAQLNYPPRTPEQVDAANRAYTRWLADFCSAAPERFAGMAPISFDNVESAVRQVAEVKENGMAGVVLPVFTVERPLYHPQYDPVWSAICDHDLVVNIHSGMSAITPMPSFRAPLPHKAMGYPIFPGFDLARYMLLHLIWGGVLERFPRLKVAFTEMGSGWVVQMLKQADYSYRGSYLNPEIHQHMSLSPREYFQRQCFLGSSTFSQAEVESRHEIGLDKMMLGVDYPHHEGAWNGGTVNYLRATVGASNVPEGEIRKLMTETAASVFGFDLKALEPIARDLDLTVELVSTPPEEDLFPRGDVHKPLV
jgi:predicted TIM-barrel fold metal-dependent hydrolase